MRFTHTKWVYVSHSETRKQPSVDLVCISECKIHGGLDCIANKLTPKLWPRSSYSYSSKVQTKSQSVSHFADSIALTKTCLKTWILNQSEEIYAFRSHSCLQCLLFKLDCSNTSDNLSSKQVHTMKGWLNILLVSKSRSRSISKHFESWHHWLTFLQEWLCISTTLSGAIEFQKNFFKREKRNGFGQN